MRPTNLNITVIGLGKIGGSLAGAFTSAGHTVTGCDREAERAQLARQQGLIAGAADSVETAVPGASMVVLALPVSEIIALIPNLSLDPGSILLDTGSTKQDVADAMLNARRGVVCFGGHPIAGNDLTGAESWNARLFADKTFVLVRTASSTDEAEQALVSVLETIGARARFMTAEDHDRVVALTSHLPIMLGMALTRTVACAESPHAAQLTGGQFNAVTRMVESPADMMADLLGSNRRNIMKSYERFDEEMRRLLSETNRDALIRKLEEIDRLHRTIAGAS